MKYRAVLFWAILACVLWQAPAWAVCSSVTGKPVGVSVANSDTAILCANPLRKSLWCQDIGATNGLYLTFDQAATSTNGFLLLATATTANGAAASSIMRWPSDGCQGAGCVPLGTVDAITVASTTPIVCWQD